MKASTLCVCGHERSPWHIRKGCVQCTCSKFEAARPPRTLADEERQMALFEDHAHQRARIYDALVDLRKAGGATYAELAQYLGLNINSVRGRLSEMEAEGVIIRTKYRRTGDKRAAALYRVVAVTNVAHAREATT